MQEFPRLCFKLCFKQGIVDIVTANIQEKLQAMKLLDTHVFKTENYGTRSAKYNCITDWYDFKKLFRHVSHEKHPFLSFKPLLKEHLCNR